MISAGTVRSAVPDAQDSPTGQMAQVQLVVVIVHYTDPESTHKALSSLRVALSMLDITTTSILVLNGLEAQLGTETRALADMVVHLPENIGFGSAVNLAVERTQSRFVFILNPDVELLPPAFTRYISTSIERFHTHPKLAVTSGHYLSGSGQFEQLALPLPSLATLLNPRKPSLQVANHQIQWQSVKNLSAVGWLVTRSAFEDVAGFDNRYFLYYEDTDLCRRLVAGGYELHLAPEVVGTHLGGGSTKSLGKLSRESLVRVSQALYVRTYMGISGQLSFSCLMLARCLQLYAREPTEWQRILVLLRRSMRRTWSKA
jgi:GT2 family glycosyltransferase